MCQHGDSTKSIIACLVQELYPAIQHQFILISSANDDEQIVSDVSRESLFELVNDLKNEFQSLTSYENRLVFPSVLKAFDRKLEHTDTGTANIAELQQLTLGKEQKIAQIISDLCHEINELPTGTASEIHRLVDLFNNDFTGQRMKWNKMIHDRLNNCACFIRMNDHNKIEINA